MVISFIISSRLHLVCVCRIYNKFCGCFDVFRAARHVTQLDSDVDAEAYSEEADVL